MNKCKFLCVFALLLTSKCSTLYQNVNVDDQRARIRYT